MNPAALIPPLVIGHPMMSRRRDGSTVASVHRTRYLPDGWSPRYLAVDWPLAAACIVSPGATLGDRYIARGSVVIVDADAMREPQAVAQFARRNKLAPLGYCTRPVPELATIAHVVVPRGFSEAAVQRASAMLAAAGTDAAALYVTERCASLLASPVPLILGLAVSA